MTTYPHTLECGPQTWERNFRGQNGISCYSQEKNFKILSRWYREPSTLHKIFPSTPAYCWHCDTASGTYLHVWWECERIRPFWIQVFQIYSKIYEEPQTSTPTISFLSMLPGSMASQKRGILCFFLSAARQLIPLCWKTATTPPLSLWVSTVNNIIRMEEIVLWFIWLRFSSSDSLATMFPNRAIPKLALIQGF